MMAQCEGILNDLSNKDTFVDTTEEELEQLIQGSKSKNTNRSIKSALTRFKAFLTNRNYPNIEDLDPQIKSLL